MKIFYQLCQVTSLWWVWKGLSACGTQSRFWQLDVAVLAYQMRVTLVAVKDVAARHAYDTEHCMRFDMHSAIVMI